MLRLTALILLFIGGLQGYGQDRKGYYQAEIGGGVTADRLPFWLHTNTFGKITNDTYLWGTVGVGTPFSKSDTRAFDYSFGFEGTGALGRKEHRIFIDQLYGRVRWQNLILDLGIIKPEIVYDGLSSTNGDMLYSTNSRSMPGINLHTQDFIKIPWIGKWVSFKARYGEYLMIDDRYAGNRTRLHHKMLDIRSFPSSASKPDSTTMPNGEERQKKTVNSRPLSKIMPGWYLLKPEEGMLLKMKSINWGTTSVMSF